MVSVMVVCPKMVTATLAAAAPDRRVRVPAPVLSVKVPLTSWPVALSVAVNVSAGMLLLSGIGEGLEAAV